MIDSSSLLTRIGWHAAFWASTASAFSILKLRLMRSWEERNSDSQAADTIVRHFQCSWEEGVLLRRTLLQDLHRKIDSLFPVEKLMLDLDSVTGEAGQVRSRKLAIWEELKIEVISRMLVGLYSSHILTEFIVVAMAIVGKSLYLRSVLREHSTVSTDDLSASNRIFVCLAARFVQHGTLLLAESVKNAVRAVFIKVSLQEPMSRILLDSLVGQVRHEVETACGKSILDDCVFGRLEEMIGADLSSTKRRLFIAMVTEARRRMKDTHFRQILIDQITQDLGALHDCVLEKGDSIQVIPLLGILPKLARKYHSMFQTAPIGVMRQLAATVFVDPDSDTHECLLHL